MSDPSDEPGELEPSAGGFALPDLESLGENLGGGALGGLLEQAQQRMQAHAESAEREVEVAAGGGMVKIKATGTGQVLSVSINPAAVDPDDVAMLEDLVLAALHDVNAQLAAVQREAMGPLGDMFGGG